MIIVSSRTFFLTLIFLLIVSCEEPSEKLVYDKEGITIRLKSSVNDADFRELQLGLRVYYPDKRALYAGGDSLSIESFYPNGNYEAEVRLGFSNNTRGAEYSLEVTGFNDETLFRFTDKFLITDTTGTLKTQIIITKSGNSYIVKGK